MFSFSDQKRDAASPRDQTAVALPPSMERWILASTGFLDAEVGARERTAISPASAAGHEGPDMDRDLAGSGLARAHRRSANSAAPHITGSAAKSTAETGDPNRCVD